MGNFKVEQIGKNVIGVKDISKIPKPDISTIKDKNLKNAANVLMKQ